MRVAAGWVVWGVLALGFTAPQVAWADETADSTCYSENQVLDVNNAQVLGWKASTPNQFHARGHVQGTVTQIFPDRSGHDHFEIAIGPNQDDTIEVIYNQEFGEMPEVSVGDTAEVCGDYITANSSSGGYPPSPSGAIIHWVHMSPNLNRHESGYVILNGTHYGGEDPNNPFNEKTHVGHRKPKHHGSSDDFAGNDPDDN